ncbi:hypothetical protein HUU05_02940 [candidate division KSB1 bacterium]|nr:hypothetical protein [candidate division KSB1 bacterium]
MRRFNPLSASSLKLLRFVRALCVVILPLGSSIVLLLVRAFSPHVTTKRIKAEEAAPCCPLPSASASQPRFSFAQLREFITPHAPYASSSLRFASFLPSLGTTTTHATEVPAAYPTLEEFEYQFEALARKFPQLVHRQIIGVSTAGQRPLWAMRLSDHAQTDEDEPAILFTALHHAREPAGVFICKALMEELLNNYGQSARHTRLLDSLDIWFVPLVNPDGYDFIMKSQRQFPWWRKNLRDNDNDGRFNPLIDGVDLNRNYDYNWQEGGEGETGSWFYRGRSAFSETEIQALRDLEVRRNFVIGVSFHSYGEAVLYPWGNFNPAPDQDLILDIAENYAAQIGRLNSRATYAVLPLNGRVGQSSVWMYGASSVIDFICETGEDYFPAPQELPRIVAENVRGGMFLLERALYSGISGHVREAQTGVPLDAEISVEGRAASYVKPRHAEGKHGRFDRLLLPGTYTISIRKSGFRTQRREHVVVNDSALTYVQVTLQRETASPSITSH